MKTFSVAVLTLSIFATPAFAESQNLCTALDALKNETQSSGEVQRVAVIKVEPMTVACTKTAVVSVQNEFCSAVLETVSLEFTHVFPWLVYDCLQRSNVHSNTMQNEQYTGLGKRKKISRLWTGWSDGTRLDIQFVPTGNWGDQPRMRDYWGRYNVVVWRP